MTSRRSWLAAAALRYPRTILSLWAALFVVFGFYGLKLPDQLKDHGLTPMKGDYAYVKQVAEAEFQLPDAPVLLVFQRKEEVSDEAFLRFIASTVQRLQGLQGLAAVKSPQEERQMLNGSYAYVLLDFQQKPYELAPVIQALEQRLKQDTAISVRMTGKSVVQQEVNRASREDLKRAELIGLPAAFLILWLAFGGLLTALLPVLTGILAVTVTMGILYGLGARLELSNFVLNVIPMVGLALSIDFALMLVSRFREELNKSPLAPVEQALRVTLATAGRAVLFSACCVLLALTGLLGIPLPLFVSVTIGAMVITAVSTLAAFTLLPALMLLMGPLIQAEAGRRKLFLGERRWGAWAALVMKRPLLMLSSALLILIGCCLPLADMKVAIPDATSLPAGSSSRQAMEMFTAQFKPPASSSVTIVTEGSFLPPAVSLRNWEQAYSLVERLEKDPMVLQVDSVFSRASMMPKQLALLAADSGKQSFFESAEDLLLTNHRLLLQVELKTPADSEAAASWVKRQAAQGKLAELPYRVGGEVKYQQEVFDILTAHLPAALLFIVLSNYTVLFFAFRSVLLPLKALLMNFISLGAAFGLLSFIFQHGLPGMEPYSIAVMIPLFICGLVFGMSMDYGVFLLSRIAESFEGTGDNDQAVRTGLASTSRVITSAAAIMIAVTLPFAFGSVVGVKQLGIGIASAIAIDATLIRLMVVPALMKLMGRWNWWSPGQSGFKA